MVEGLQSPGPGWRNMRFSDGTFAWISPKIKDEQWGSIKAQKEAELDAQYMAQAKAEDRPVTTVDKTYSATAVRPSTPYGHLMGWIDHNLGGNRLNANPTAQSVNAAVRPAVGPAMRIGTAAIERNPYVGAVDLGLTGANVAKHVAAKVYPGVNQVPDFPTILSQVRSLTGTPELSPDAPAAQRVLENAASVAIGNPKANFLDAAGRAGASYLGGEAGEELLGEPGQFLGSFGGSAPGSGRALFQRVLAPVFRGKNTQTVSGAADRQGIQPTMGSVSNIMGRLVEKGLAATPWVGSSVRSAQDKFNDAIRQRQQEVGEDVFGGPLPGDISDESIGGSLIKGARQGAANITQRARDEQNQLSTDIGTKTPVDARGVYRGPAGYSAARLQMDPSVYPAYAARLDTLRQMAIEAQHPFFQQFWGQLAAGEVPFARFQELRSNLGADLPGFSGMTKGQQDQLYEAMTDAMRDAARQRGGQALADRFDSANANYKSLIGAGGQREQLEAIGGKPQSGGGWAQFFGPQGQTQPATGVDFTGGKGEGQAAAWFKSNLRSPDKLAAFANPTIVPNDFWREAVGQWLATRGQTPEGTFRPDQMAREFGGDGDTRSNTGVGPEVQTQMFTGPTGAPTANIQDMNDLATLGRNAVVPINRSGLTDTAGVMYALKKASDWATQGLGTVGGVALMGLAGRNLSDPDFVNAIRGQGTPLVNSLYSGVPAATQNILQYQNNPPPVYDPLGYSVTANQKPPQ